MTPILTAMVSHPRMTCQGYKKEGCWLKTITDSLCASCHSERSRDTLASFASTLHKIPLTQIYNVFTSDSIQSALHSCSINNSILDTVLAAIYRASKEECAKCVNFINSSPLKSTLLLRVRNHTDTLCPVVSWMMRSDLFNESIVPSCIHCMADTLRKADRNHQLNHPIYRMLREHTENNVVTRAMGLIRNSEDTHYTNCLYLANAMIESSNNIVKNSLFSILMSAPFNSEVMREFAADVHKHPQLFDWTDAQRIQAIKELLKERITPWREELAAKCWHPSRFIEWCLDPEEAAEWGIPCPHPPKTSKRAMWHIAW